MKEKSFERFSKAVKVIRLLLTNDPPADVILLDLPLLATDSMIRQMRS
jgi:hypothetical protein